MKKILLISLGIPIAAVVICLGLFQWFNYVPLDQERIASILQEYEESIPPRPPDDQNRIVDLVKMGEEVKELHYEWRKEKNVDWEDWARKPLFDRERISYKEFSDLFSHMAQNYKLKLKFEDRIKKTVGVIPHNFKNPFAKDNISLMPILRLGEHTLMECDLRALQKDWPAMEGPLWSTLGLSFEISKRPTTLIGSMIGATHMSTPPHPTSPQKGEAPTERKPFILEIGPGRGDFLFHLAEENPHKEFVAIEYKRKRHEKLMRRSKPFPNVTLLLGNAREIVPEEFPEETFEEVYILFPDLLIH